MVVPQIASLAAFRSEKMGKADVAWTSRLFVGLNCFEPGQEHALHTHAGQDKVYLVLEGRGIATVRDNETAIGPGDLVLAEADEPHALKNPGPEKLIAAVFMAPPPVKKA